MILWFLTVLCLNKKLKHFEKIDLNPGESKTVTFTIDSKTLAFVNTKNEWITEAGTFIVSIGDQKGTFFFGLK